MNTSSLDEILNQSGDEDLDTSSSPRDSTATDTKKHAAVTDTDEYPTVIDADELKIRTNNYWKVMNKRSFYWQFFFTLIMNGKEKQGTKNAPTTCWMYCIVTSRMDQNKIK